MSEQLLHAERRWCEATASRDLISARYILALETVAFAAMSGQAIDVADAEAVEGLRAGKERAEVALNSARAEYNDLICGEKV